jgi:hypothetical protein
MVQMHKNQVFLLTMIILHKACHKKTKQKQGDSIISYGKNYVWGKKFPAKSAGLGGFGNKGLRIWAAKMTG